MELTPRAPPGHRRRKLRGLVSEIARLRSEGHSIHAIQEALADAGVNASLATVQREVARLSQPSSVPGTARQTAKPALPVEADQGPTRVPAAAIDVDSYFDQHNNNPLFRKKGTS